MNRKEVGIARMRDTFTDLTVICILTFISANNVQTHPSKQSVVTSAPLPSGNTLPAGNTTLNVALQTPVNSNGTATSIQGQSQPSSETPLITPNSGANQTSILTPNANVTSVKVSPAPAQNITVKSSAAKASSKSNKRGTNKQTRKSKLKKQAEVTKFEDKASKQTTESQRIHTSDPERKSAGQSKQEMIINLSNLAKAGPSFGGFATKLLKGNPPCKVEFTEMANAKTLQDLFALVGEGYIDAIVSASRGFLRGCYIVDGSSKMIVDTCNTKKIEFQGLLTTSYKPISWIHIPGGDRMTASFNYENMILAKKDTPTTMYMNCSGSLNLNGDLVTNYRLKKADKDSSNTNIDGDVYLDITLNGGFSATKFLQLVKKSRNDLYKKSGVEAIDASLQTLDFAQQITFIPTEEMAYYTTYIQGVSSTEGNILAKMKNLCIVCTNDLLKSQCALLGIVATLEGNPILNIVPGIDIAHMATKIKLFQGLSFPKMLLLQSSKTGMPDISMLPWYNDIANVILNENRENKEETTDQGIIADTCFRYRNEGMHNGYDVLVLMCPERNTFKFFLPDLVPDHIGELLSLLHGGQWRQQEHLRLWLEQNQGESMTIDHVEVSGSVLSNEVVYTQKIVFKPRVGNVTTEPFSGYLLIQSLAFSRILRSTIHATITSGGIEIGGAGDREKFLGTFGSFVLEGGVGSEPTIHFTLNVPSNRLLILALRESREDTGEREANKDGYKTDYTALKNITLKSLTLDTKVSATEFKFISDAEIGDIEGAKFQLYLYGSTQTASCFYKEEPGDLYQFLDTIQEATFFDQTWIKYDQIGVMISPPVQTGNNLCFMKMNKNTRWNNPEEVGLKIVNINLNCNNARGTNEAEEKTRGCKYLENIFGGPKITTELVGWMSKTGMRVVGTSPNVLKLGKHVTIKGRDGDLKTIIRLIPAEQMSNKVLKEKESFVRVQGDLTFSTYTLPCALVVSGDVVWLKIIKVASQAEEALKLYEGITTVWVIPHGRIQTEWNQALSVIETTSNMFMGRAFLREQYPIVFKTGSLERQYIDPEDTTRSRFYGCKKSKYRVAMAKLLTMLSHSGVYGFLTYSRIKDLCIAYNDGESEWDITNVGIVVPTDFSITGTLTTDFGKGGREKELPMQASIVDENLELCVVLPVQKWGRSEIKNEEDDNDDGSEDDADEEETVPTNTNAAQDEQIIINGFKCLLSDGYGVMNKEGVRDETSSTFAEIKQCVAECIKEQEKDYTYNGININKATKECHCVRNMQFIEEAKGSFSGFRTCFLKPLKTHLVEMYSGKGMAKEGFGPKFCYVLPSNRNGPYSAYMKGYLKTFAFEMEDARFNIMPSETYPKRLRRIVLEHDNIKLFNTVNGYIKLVDNSIGRDPSDISFTVDIKLGRLQGYETQLASALNTISTKELALFTKVKNQYQTYLEKLTEWIKIVDDEIRRLDAFGKSVKRQFQMDGMNRARAMKAYQRECAKECGFLELPGWDVETACSDKNADRPLSCLKFSKNASVASNVGCISNCEAERVKSNIEAKEFHARSVLSGSYVDQDENCKRKGEQFRNQIDEIRQVAQEYSGRVDAAIAQINSHKESSSVFYQTAFRSIRSKMDLADVGDSNCLDFVWRNTQFGDSSKKLCFEGFFHNLVSTVYKDNSGTEERKKTLADVSGHDVMIDKVLRRGEENAQSRLIEEKKKRFEKCMSNRKKKAVKVGKSVRSLPRLNNGDFTIFGKSTTEAFYERSPWVVARKRDMLQNLVHSKETPVPRNISEDVKGNSCSSAKRAASEYNEISKYVHSWVTEHEAAKRTLNEIKKETMQALKRHAVTPYNKESNFSKSEEEAFNFWTNLTEAGMKEWADIEDQRLAEYNQESIPVIRKQIQMAYGNGKSKNLQEFFAHRSTEGANAFKRANIEVPSPYTFSELSKTLVSTLENGKSLEAISDTIEDAVRRSEILHKRTLPCSS